eukprot:g4000.t1
MLFQFNDFGAWFSFSRWRTDMQRIASASQELHQVAKSAASIGAVDVIDPSFKQPDWRIGLVTYCNYNNSHGLERVQNEPLLCSSLALAEIQLPVVDLEKSHWKERALDALRTSSAFLLTNHGLGTSSSGLWGQALEAARQLFALPEDVKLQVAAGPPSVDAPVVRGYFGVGAESGTRSSRFECKEGVSLAAGERSERLARNRLPKEFPVDQVAALEFRCAGRAPVSAELLWSSDHTDWGSLTIIAQDSNDGGLEIFQNGEYHPVASKDGALIVNGGDYLELVSHGTLLSPLHRVRERTPSSRRSSLVYFHYPAASSPLRPIDVKKAHERTRPSRPGLVFNTLTDGLEDLEEAITYKSHLQRKWMGVRAKTELCHESDSTVTEQQRCLCEKARLQAIAH